jgi:hypothetical protein
MCIWYIDVDTIYCLVVCADVAPCEREVELLRASARQELGRPPRGVSWVGERCRCEDAEVRPVDPKRAVRRHRFDDPVVRPLHAPPVGARVDFEDIFRHLEVVLQGVPEGMRSCIQDEGIMEQCVGVLPLCRDVVWQAEVAGVAMTRWLPPD